MFGPLQQTKLAPFALQARKSTICIDEEQGHEEGKEGEREEGGGPTRGRGREVPRRRKKPERKTLELVENYILVTEYAFGHVE